MGYYSKAVRTSVGSEFPRCRTGGLWYVERKFEPVDRQTFDRAIDFVTSPSPTKFHFSEGQCEKNGTVIRMAGACIQ